MHLIITLPASKYVTNLNNNTSSICLTKYSLFPFLFFFYFSALPPFRFIFLISPFFIFFIFFLFAFNIQSRRVKVHLLPFLVSSGSFTFSTFVIVDIFSPFFINFLRGRITLNFLFAYQTHPNSYL